MRLRTFSQSRLFELGVLFLAFCHLLLVAVGASHHSFWRLGRLGRWIEDYGRFSGSNGSFSFFAPDVGGGLRAEFDLYDAKGKQLGTEALASGPTREINLRVNGIVGILSYDLDNEGTRRMVSASLAGKMFARHPEAARVVVRVEGIDIPSMTDYRTGVRYDWEPIYRAAYVQRGISP